MPVFLVLKLLQIGVYVVTPIGFGTIGSAP
jgi:hypothetical protein